MPWPPIVGDRLPRAAEAFGITEKLVTYSLNLDHPDGSAKAKGFEQILGIGPADLDYLDHTLRAGVLDAAITDVRDNPPWGLLCEVRVSVAGLHEKSGRVVSVTTSWELRHADDRPRLVTAYISS